MGEVGLAGEVRPIGQVERRISECHRLGFTDEASLQPVVCL